MAGTLSPTIFHNFQNKFRERCITLFIEAYYTSIANNVITLNFEENDITSILHNYIDENPKRIKWDITTNTENFIFDKSVEYSKGFASKFSRIDLRFVQRWKREFEYKYYIEAKNLKSNDSALKRRYIETGIDNFLPKGKYYHCDGFLVGYILEGTVENCREGINKLLKKDNRDKEEIYKAGSFLSIENHFSKHAEKEIFHLFLNYLN